jgi:hypothetical protein
MTGTPGRPRFAARTSWRRGTISPGERATPEETALALRTAEAAVITLVAVARDDGFEVFTHANRMAFECAAHVA